MKLEKLKEAKEIERIIVDADRAVSQVKEAIQQYSNAHIELRIGHSGKYLPIPSGLQNHFYGTLLVEWERILHEAKTKLENL